MEKEKSAPLMLISSSWVGFCYLGVMVGLESKLGTSPDSCCSPHTFPFASGKMAHPHYRECSY